MVAGGRELIDTLWNVNLHTPEKKKTERGELIDTLWNVNRELKQIIGKWKPRN